MNKTVAIATIFAISACAAPPPPAPIVPAFARGELSHYPNPRQNFAIQIALERFVPPGKLVRLRERAVRENGPTDEDFDFCGYADFVTTATRQLSHPAQIYGEWRSGKGTRIITGKEASSLCTKRVTNRPS